MRYLCSRIRLLEEVFFVVNIGPDMSTDIRVYSMRLLKSISVPDIVPMIYPRLFPLFDLTPEVFLAIYARLAKFLVTVVKPYYL